MNHGHHEIIALPFGCELRWKTQTITVGKRKEIDSRDGVAAGGWGAQALPTFFGIIGIHWDQFEWGRNRWVPLVDRRL